MLPGAMDTGFPLAMACERPWPALGSESVRPLPSGDGRHPLMDFLLHAFS